MNDKADNEKKDGNKKDESTSFSVLKENLVEFRMFGHS